MEALGIAGSTPIIAQALEAGGPALLVELEGHELRLGSAVGIAPQNMFADHRHLLGENGLNADISSTGLPGGIDALLDEPRSSSKIASWTAMRSARA